MTSKLLMGVLMLASGCRTLPIPAIFDVNKHQLDCSDGATEKLSQTEFNGRPAQFKSTLSVQKKLCNGAKSVDLTQLRAAEDWLFAAMEVDVLKNKAEARGQATSRLAALDAAYVPAGATLASQTANLDAADEAAKSAPSAPDLCPSDSVRIAVEEKARSEIAEAFGRKESAVSLPRVGSTSVSTGNLQSDIINGVAQFVTSRAREEVVSYSLGKFTSVICEDYANTCSTNFIATYFPHVCGMDAFARDSGGGLAADQMLNAALRADLFGFPRALAVHFGTNVIEKTPKFDRAGKTKAEIGAEDAKREALRKVRAAKVHALSCGFAIASRAGTAMAESPADWKAVISGALNKNVLRASCAGILDGDGVAEAMPAFLQGAADKQEASTFAKVLDGDQAALLAAKPDDRQAAAIQFVLDIVRALVQLISKDEISKANDRARTEEFAILRAALGASGSFLAGNSSDGLVQLTALLQQTDMLSTVPALGSLAKYAPLATSIANAKSSEDISTALEKFATPVGQYQLRHFPLRFMAGLSGRVGAAAGVELNFMGPQTATAATGGPSIPVGFDFSMGVSAGAIVAHVQAIDLGALASFQFASSVVNIKPAPNVTFQQVLAPGFSLGFEIGDSPVVAWAGVEYVPALRTTAVAGETFDAVRITAGLSIDVPIFLFSLH